MEAAHAYQYSARPTRNPLRYLLALWRLSKDLTRTDEAAIVEIGFARSRWGRRLACWDAVAGRLAGDSRTADRLRSLARLGPIDLGALSRLPPGSVGRVFADHCRARRIDPNLVFVPAEERGDLVLAHLFETHDLWHVTTGWGNDEEGEVGLGGFYLAQLEAPFFAFLLAIVLANTVFVAPGSLRSRMDALVEGYQMGRRAQPLFGLTWPELFARPLEEVRDALGLEASHVVGEGIPGAPRSTQTTTFDRSDGSRSSEGVTLFASTDPFSS